MFSNIGLDEIVLCPTLFTLLNSIILAQLYQFGNNLSTFLLKLLYIKPKDKIRQFFFFFFVEITVAKK